MDLRRASAPAVKPKLGRGGWLATVVVVLGIATYLPVLGERYGDFRAFYCAGRAVLAHADPYRERPLRECERDVAAPGVSPWPDDAAIPAPFPGYVLAAFAALALLPFGSAAALWLVLSLAAVTQACRLFARSIRAPAAAFAIVIGFPAVSAALQLGQVTPFVLLALSATAMLLAADRPRAAALAALGLTLEPQIAAAALVALFIGEPRSRSTLVAGGSFLALLSLAAVGVDVNREYVREVLPAHALANLFDVQQYSAAHLAALAGLAPGLARSLGSWWYCAAASLGAALALRLRSRFGPQALVLVPVAFEVFGGVYVHMSQLAFAVPAFLLALPRAGAARAWAVGAIFVAALPWNMIANYPMFAPAVALLALALCGCLGVERIAFGLALLTSSMFLGFFTTGVLALPAAQVHVGALWADGNPLADLSWEHWQNALRAQRSAALSAWSIAVQLPTFAAFAALLGALAVAALRPGTLGTPSVAES